MAAYSTAERHVHTMQIMREQGHTSVSRLSKELEVSEVTIRKDLRTLEARKLLVRTVSIKAVSREPRSRSMASLTARLVVSGPGVNRSLSRPSERLVIAVAIALRKQERIPISKES